MKTDSPVEKVLFFVDGETELASMAASLLLARVGTRFDIASAGTNPGPVSALAQQALGELEIDSSKFPGQHIGELGDAQFSHVILICQDADENCLFFPRDHDVTYWQVPDPSAVDGNDQLRLDAYRQARDALAVRVEAWLASL